MRVPWIAILAAFVLSACNSRPPIPELPKTDGPAISHIILGSELKASDIRRLLKALNHNGQIETLHSFVHEVSDESLEIFAGQFSRYVYQEADLPDSLPSFFRRRVENRSFSAFDKGIKKWSSLSSFPAEKKALWSLFSNPKFISVVESRAEILESRIWDVIPRFFSSFSIVESTPVFLANELATDILDLVRTDKFISDWTALWPRLLNSRFPDHFLTALRSLQENNEQSAFKAFSIRISEMLRERSDSRESLQSLLQFFQVLDGPSQGLFVTLKDKVTKSPDTLIVFETWFQQHMAKIVSHRIQGAFTDSEGGFNKPFWLELSHAPESGMLSPAFVRTFTTIQKSLERSIQRLRPESASDSFLSNLPIRLCTYAITKWLQTFAVQNRTQLNNSATNEFPDVIWQKPVRIPAINLDLSSLETQKELMQLGLISFAKELSEISKRPGYGNFQYEFIESNGETLEEALKQAIEYANEVRPLTSFNGALRAVAYSLTEGSIPIFSFDALEEIPNLLNALNSLLANLTPSKLESLRSLFFEDLKAHELPKKLHENITSLFEGAQKERVDRALKGLAALKKFLDPLSDQGIPPSRLYHQWVSSTPLSDMHSVSEVFRFLNVYGIFTPQHPGIFEWLKRAYLADTLSFFAKATPSEQRELLALFISIGGEPSSHSILHLFQMVTHESYDGVRHGLSKFIQNPEEAFHTLSFLTASERHWVYRYISSGDFAKLSNRILQKGEREKTRQVVIELERLVRNGTLERVAKLLGEIKNERLKVLSAMGVQSIQSGEFPALLQAIQGIM